MTIDVSSNFMLQENETLIEDGLVLLDLPVENTVIPMSFIPACFIS